MVGVLPVVGVVTGVLPVVGVVTGVLPVVGVVTAVAATATGGVAAGAGATVGAVAGVVGVVGGMGLVAVVGATSSVEVVVDTGGATVMWSTVVGVVVAGGGSTRGFGVQRLGDRDADAGGGDGADTGGDHDRAAAAWCGHGAVLLWRRLHGGHDDGRRAVGSVLDDRGDELVALQIDADLGSCVGGLEADPDAPRAVVVDAVRPAVRR